MPGAARPSRNAPCPCGSGRKYKNCCLAADDAAQQRQAGLHRFGDVLVEMLFTDELAPARGRLWERFWPGRPPVPLAQAMAIARRDRPAAAAFDLEGFIIWATTTAPLEGVPASAGTPAAEPGEAPRLLDVGLGGAKFSGSHGAAWARGQSVVREWEASFHTACQLRRADPSRGALLRDLWSDEPYEVRAAAFPAGAVIGDVLILALRPDGGAFEPVGPFWSLPAFSADRLRRFGTEQLALLRAVEPDADLQRLWFQRGELLHHFLVRWRETAPAPGVSLGDGEPIVFCDAAWRVAEGDAPDLARALDACPELRAMISTPLWQWAMRVPAAGGGAGAGDVPGRGRTPEAPATAAHLGEGFHQGTVTLRLAAPDGAAGGRQGEAGAPRPAGWRLELQANSEAALAAGRALIARAAGGRIAAGEEGAGAPLEEDLAAPVTAAAAELAATAPAPGGEIAVVAADRPDVGAAVVAELERRWVDTHNPVLGGLTPREAAASATPAVRRALDDLLLSAENLELRSPPGHGIQTMSAARLRGLLRPGAAAAGGGGPHREASTPDGPDASPAAGGTPGGGRPHT